MGGSKSKADQIFISYRRSDSAGAAGRIYDRLVQRFGKSAVFKDVDSIPLGVNFKKHLDSVVEQCSVVLVIIGDRWLEKDVAAGQGRIDDPRDFVRIEIESALQRGIPVIPLFVESASAPLVSELPETLEELAYRNGMVVGHDPHFHTDMGRLIENLEILFAGTSNAKDQEREASTARSFDASVSPHSEEESGREQVDGAVLSAPYDPQATKHIAEAHKNDPPTTEVLPGNSSSPSTAPASTSEPRLPDVVPQSVKPSQEPASKKTSRFKRVIRAMIKCGLIGILPGILVGVIAGLATIRGRPARFDEQLAAVGGGALGGFVVGAILFPPLWKFIKYVWKD